VAKVISFVQKGLGLLVLSHTFMYNVHDK